MMIKSCKGKGKKPVFFRLGELFHLLQTRFHRRNGSLQIVIFGSRLLQLNAYAEDGNYV